MKATDTQEFQWALAAVLAHAEDMCNEGSYKKKQTQMMHAQLNRQWKKLRDVIDAAMEGE